MDHNEFMEHLRDSQQSEQSQTPTRQAVQAQQTAAPRKKKSQLPTVVGGFAVLLLVVSLLFLFSAQKKAENITSSLDPEVLKGLVVDRAFSPTSGRRYVQVSAGRERSVSNVTEAGLALPVISRDNYKALTTDNYALIGKAPWALSINVSSNAEDPELLRHLFNQDATAKAFLAREDVAPLLENPANLAAIAKNEQALKSFFEDDTVQQVLASEQLTRAIAGSRLFSYLLISKSGKYYRDHPTVAAQLIQKSPTLSALKRNPNVRKAVQENPYLKNIAATLLK